MSRKKFIVTVVLSVVVTIFLGLHVANLLFGTNSYEVYDSLKNKKAYLKNEITRLQFENARLQKEYFELKNLEPEE
ncbi:septum formation initiator [Candidatus Marinarcus aquaticus]|uniref:Septum formation initiator n=1 Tax=Candidatus Marinarcus aquaticus TaxID=2044504 RepID=A0A4Q0XQU0_9BACT|nr:septum formation initiator [Candidatus Marinarcus aquaticus]